MPKMVSSRRGAGRGTGENDMYSPMDGVGTEAANTSQDGGTGGGRYGDGMTPWGETDTKRELFRQESTDATVEVEKYGDVRMPSLDTVNEKNEDPEDLDEPCKDGLTGDDELAGDDDSFPTCLA